MPRVKSLNPQRDEIKKLFKHALTDMNMKQKDVAKRCGLTESQVSAVINHPEPRNFETVLSVARALGIKQLPVI